ncbi:hypothetical protein [Capnocytophaga sp.]|nr:hypothetical protein [Capnocytophaga sp.]MDO5105891.1 hypothetical protein [Capnocytophaga sp.]
MLEHYITDVVINVKEAESRTALEVRCVQQAQPVLAEKRHSK